MIPPRPPHISEDGNLQLATSPFTLAWCEVAADMGFNAYMELTRSMLQSAEEMGANALHTHTFQAVYLALCNAIVTQDMAVSILIAEEAGRTEEEIRAQTNRDIASYVECFRLNIEDNLTRAVERLRKKGAPPFSSATKKEDPNIRTVDDE